MKKEFNSENIYSIFNIFNIFSIKYTRGDKDNCFTKKCNVFQEKARISRKGIKENRGKITGKINVVQSLLSTTRACNQTNMPIQRRLRVQGHRVSRSTATRSQIKEAGILSPFSFASPRPVSNRFTRCQQVGPLFLSGYSQVYRSCRVARPAIAAQ